MSTVCYRCGGAPNLSYTVSRVSQTTPQSSLYDYTTNVVGVAGPLRVYVHTQAGLPTLRDQRLISRHALALFSNVRYVMYNCLQNNAQT